jgi:hypothetical protein
MVKESKEELRKHLLKAMCNFSQKSNLYFRGWINQEMSSGLSFLEPLFCPRAFKPGVSDRYLFNEIINENIDEIFEENNVGRCLGNYLTIGINLMSVYYQRYGEWVERKDLDLS